MARSITSKTPAVKRGMSNTPDPQGPVIPANLSGVVTVTTTTSAGLTEATPVTETNPPTPVRRKRVATVTEDQAQAEYAAIKPPRASKKAQAEVSAATQVAEVAPKPATRTKRTKRAPKPTLPENATPVMVETWDAMHAGASGFPTVIAGDVKGAGLARVKAALMTLSQLGLISRVIEPIEISGKVRDAEAFYLLGKAPELTAPRELTTSEIATSARTTSAPARKVAKAVPTAADMRKMAREVNVPRVAKPDTTKTEVKPAARAPRADQQRPFVDGQQRTEKVNGRIRVIGQPLNANRHAPGGLQDEVSAFLLASAGAWFKVSEIASTLDRWPAQTGRTSAVLVGKGALTSADGTVYHIETREGPKSFRAVIETKAPVKRASRTRKP